MRKKALRFCLVIGFVMLLTACLGSEPPEMAQMSNWSPDEALIAYVCYKDGPIHRDLDTGEAEFDEHAAEICVMNSDGTNSRRLTYDQSGDSDPAWSYDGKTIAYIADDGLYIVDLQSNKSRKLFEGRQIIWDAPRWSPDGSQIAFAVCRSLESSQGSDIFIVNRDGDHLIRIENPHGETLDRPRWSPDGNRLAYRANSDPVCDQVNALSDNKYRLMIAHTRITSPTISAVENLSTLSQLVWSDRHTIVYSVRSGESSFDLYSLDLESGVSTLIKSGIGYFWALDGSSLAFTDYYRHGLYVEDLASPTITPISDTDLEIHGMQWSPNGQYLLVDLMEPVPGRLNSTYTGTIWVFRRDGALAKRLTPLLPTDRDR